MKSTRRIPYLLGVDVGTTGTKARLFTSDGLAVGQSWSGHAASSYPGGGAVEQDPEEWWSAVKASLRALTKIRGERQIKAIGITGLALTTVLIGKGGKVLRSAMLYSDARNREHNAQVASIVSEPGYGTLKHFGDLIWAMKNEGLSAEDVSAVTDALGFVCYKLTGRAAFDSYLMPSSQVEKLSSELGLQSGCFGVPHGSADIVGEVTAKAAKDTDLPKGLPVIVAPWDGMCNIVGSGLTEPGVAADAAGSTEILAVTTSKKPDVMSLPHIVPGLYFTYTSPPLGTLHKSFATEFFASKTRESPYDLLEKEARRSLPGAQGLLFVPCDPSMKPGRDPTASFVGMTPKHKKSHFARAVLEGIAFRIRRVLDAVEEAGVPIREVRVSGGGSKSDFWTQIRADVTGRTFVRMREIETGCLGAAMLAGVGTGVFSDILDATSKTVRRAKVFVPDRGRHRGYDGLFTEFVRASEKLC